MFTLGWHVEGFVKMLLLDSIGPNIVEMSLHHIVTVYLIGGAYLVNFVNIGASIILIHDSTDVLVTATRGLIETKFKKMLYTSTFICLSCWIYGRLYMFS